MIVFLCREVVDCIGGMYSKFTFRGESALVVSQVLRKLTCSSKIEDSGFSLSGGGK